MGRTDRLRAGAGEVWESLFAHPFVREMAAGTLPAQKFRFYVEQNIMYLPELSRAMSLGAAKARDVDEMTLFASNALQLLEVEVPANRRLLERAVELAPDARNPPVMSPACAAYTSFLTSVGALHGPTEIMAAIMPCAMSYGEIARSLGEVAPHPIYSEWVGFFASDEYAAVVAPARRGARRHGGARGRVGPPGDLHHRGPVRAPVLGHGLRLDPVAGPRPGLRGPRAPRDRLPAAQAAAADIWESQWTTSTRLRSPSLRSALWAWVLTVEALMKRRSLISR